MKVLDLLLEYGADVNIKTETGHIPLIMAISGANYERSLIVTKKLIEYGANVNPKLENNMEPIFWAILQDPSFHHDDRSEMVRLLIEAGADLTEARLEGRTPLEIATEIGSIEAAELLLYNIYK
jgi:ankyrin repeat protein